MTGYDLFNSFTSAHLAEALKSLNLPVSGSKPQRIQRLISQNSPTSELLRLFSVEALRRACTVLGMPVGRKADMVGRLAALAVGQGGPAGDATSGTFLRQRILRPLGGLLTSGGYRTAGSIVLFLFVVAAIVFLIFFKDDLQRNATIKRITGGTADLQRVNTRPPLANPTPTPGRITVSPTADPESSQLTPVPIPYDLGDLEIRVSPFEDDLILYSIATPDGAHLSFQGTRHPDGSIKGLEQVVVTRDGFQTTLFFAVNGSVVRVEGVDAAAGATAALGLHYAADALTLDIFDSADATIPVKTLTLSANDYPDLRDALNRFSSSSKAPPAKGAGQSRETVREHAASQSRPPGSMSEQEGTHLIAKTTSAAFGLHYAPNTLTLGILDSANATFPLGKSTLSTNDYPDLQDVLNRFSQSSQALPAKEANQVLEIAGKSGAPLPQPASGVSAQEEVMLIVRTTVVDAQGREVKEATAHSLKLEYILGPVTGLSVIEPRRRGLMEWDGGGEFRAVVPLKKDISALEAKEKCEDFWDGVGDIALALSAVGFVATVALFPGTGLVAVIGATTAGTLEGISAGMTIITFTIGATVKGFVDCKVVGNLFSDEIVAFRNEVNSEWLFISSVKESNRPWRPEPVFLSSQTHPDTLSFAVESLNGTDLAGDRTVERQSRIVLYDLLDMNSLFPLSTTLDIGEPATFEAWASGGEPPFRVLWRAGDTGPETTGETGEWQRLDGSYGVTSKATFSFNKPNESTSVAVIVEDSRGFQVMEVALVEVKATALPLPDDGLPFEEYNQPPEMSGCFEWENVSLFPDWVRNIRIRFERGEKLTWADGRPYCPPQE